MKLLELLMRGGKFGHFWSKQTKETTWWETASIPNLDDLNTDKEDLYFGVHPSRIKKGIKEATTLEDIQAINCLYAEFDAVEFNDNKNLAAAHIKSMRPLPTYIIDSGGGYHCYWILNEPFTLDNSLKFEIARDLQRDWVHYVGGSLEVHDLARILRIPDTWNFKYDPPREVNIVYANPTKLYTLAELQDVIPQMAEHRGDEVVPSAPKPNDLSEQVIVDLAQNASDGAKFKRLFRGIDEGYASPSEADLAFCQILAFWSGGEYKKIDRIFRASGRMRAKWERQDYRSNTITKAVLNTKEYYTDPHGLLTAGANDEGNANCTYGRYKDTLTYTDAQGWMYYTGDHWETELAEGHIQEGIVQTLKARRRAAVEVEDKDILRAANPSANHVSSTMKLLKRKIATPYSDFDGALHELNCSNGVLDLRTGKLQPHHYSRKFTYALKSRYVPEADQSFWKDWLLEVVGGHQDIAEFMQLAVGYSITGSLREEAMFYIYGPPRAGKGVFTETIIKMLGVRPLATEVDITMFMTTQNNSSVGFSLASLKAARFVAASESKETEWLNASRIKQWTGSNLVTCAHKYGKDFTYTPQFKIWLTSNYLPQMDADDDAAWNRLRVIHFPNSYLGREDKLLKEKMLEPKTLEGILAWAVEGSIKWFQLGTRRLHVPETVFKTTKEARAELDWVANWIQEEVEITDRDEDVVPTDLYYPEYKDWCFNNGVSPKSLRALNKTLRQHGYEVGVVKRVGSTTKRCWIGARVNGLRRSLSELSNDC